MSFEKSRIEYFMTGKVKLFSTVSVVSKSGPQN